MPDHGRPELSIAGYTICRRCPAFVLNEVAHKTGGMCADCFRAAANHVLDAVVVRTEEREPLRLKIHASRKSPAEQRRRAKRPKSARDRAQGKKAERAALKAMRRLRDIFPEIYEVLLADERAKAGLNAWTIDRCLTPHDTASSLEFVQTYHRLNKAS